MLIHTSGAQTIVQYKTDFEGKIMWHLHFYDQKLDNFNLTFVQ